MPRVKRGVTARARHKKVLDQAKGFRGRRKKRIPRCQRGGDEGRAIRLSRPARSQTGIPRAVDYAHQCRGARGAG
jgi:hypothetical protein